MNKKDINLAFFTLFIVGLFSSLTLNLSAQNKVWVENNQPQKVDAADKVLQNYIGISSLPMNKRQKTFSDLSAEDKANAFKLHLALQFVERPNLTADQKGIILESISAITPDTYDRTKDRKNTESVAQSIQARATSVFSRQEAFEIFASLGGTQVEVEYLQKYLDFTNLKMLSERKEFFGNASSQDKSQYWKTHFALSFVVFPDLNKQQKEVILDAIALVNPQIYEVPKNSSEWKIRSDELSEALSKRAVEAFSKEVGVKIFLKLGGEAELRPAECGCSIGSIAGCWTENCVGGMCRRTDGGCGLFWQYDCNGAC